jgi:hypothetical protein
MEHMRQCVGVTPPVVGAGRLAGGATRVLLLLCQLRSARMEHGSRKKRNGMMQSHAAERKPATPCTGNGNTRLG